MGGMMHKRRNALLEICRAIGILVIVPAIAGCASMTPPQRLYDASTETSDIRTDVDADTIALKRLIDTGKRKDARLKRNEIIAARKYAIDMQYTQYETALTREVQVSDFGAKAANIALATTAEFVPVVHTKDMLNGIALGMTNLEGAYSDKVLRGKLVENVQSSMRSARHDRAAVIYANMRCSIKTYPMAMALSDLEAYYRAGTFTAGLIKLATTVTKEETNAATNADAQKPGNSDAQAKLTGMAVEAQMKAQAAVNPTDTTVTVVTKNGKRTVPGAHRCSPNDVAD